jgi:hypothetical protein
METKHTPGPWKMAKYKATEDTQNHNIYGIAPDDGRIVTISTVYPISDDGQTGAESHCNARLITAAPAMLKALQQIVADYDYEKGNCKPHTLAGHAKRAIEQATGE